MLKHINHVNSLCIAVCQLPLPIPKSICNCSGELSVIPGKITSVVTINGMLQKSYYQGGRKLANSN